MKDCPWINTCVTANNFVFFILLLISSILIFAIQIAFVIYVNAYYPFVGGPLAGVIILSIMPGLAIVLLASLLVSLAYFRMYLGLTTYEYLMKKGEKKGAELLEKEQKRLDSRKADIEKEQERVREEWRQNRERELELKRQREVLKAERSEHTAEIETDIEQQPSVVEAAAVPADVPANQTRPDEQTLAIS
jgi:hypothetical protein